jgi:hypothetical protein
MECQNEGCVMGLRIGLVPGSSKHCNEYSTSIKGGEISVNLSNYEILNKDSAPWS